MERTLFAIIFGIFVALTARDLFYGSTNAQESNKGDDFQEIDGSDGESYSHSQVKKDIPNLNFKPEMTGSPKLKILYCYSCGYRRAFDEYSSVLRERFPRMIIIGDNYTPGFLKHKLVQFLTVAKLAVIGLVIGNVNPFTYFGMNTPGVWTWMSTHKMYACLMTFFLSNTLEGSLMSSGAFEIYYNDVPVWSKLSTGRIPSPPELFEILENQGKMGLNDFDIHTLPGRLA